MTCRFPIIAEDAATDPLVQEVYAEIRRDLGFGIVPNVFKAMASRPTLLRANWIMFRSVILEGRLPRTIKEMVGVLISQSNQSDYAMKVHLHGLSAMGLSQEVLQMLVQDYSRCPLPERDKLVLRFGLLAAADPLSLSDADYDQLRAHDLSNEEIFEIVATAGLFSSINSFTDSANVPLDQL